ncbi:MAG: hypothetical protein ABJB85_02195, partial [Nitrososphaerota archaeon]
LVYPLAHLLVSKWTGENWSGSSLGEIPAYKIIYNYIDSYPYGDDVPMTSFNVFAVNHYSAYWISIKAPSAMTFQYVPRVEKIIESFAITS